MVNRSVKGALLALVCVLGVSGCGGDRVETDLGQLDRALVALDQPPAGLDNVIAQIRLAQSNADRAALMRGFADMAKQQAAALNRFDPQSPAVDKPRAAMAQGIEMAGRHAEHAAAAYSANGEAAAPTMQADMREMSLAYTHYQQGVRELQSVAREKGVTLRFDRN